MAGGATRPMTRQPETREEWAALLADRIDDSGLSARRFEREVLRRDERSIRRWLACDSPIPGEVQEFLMRPEPAPGQPCRPSCPRAIARRAPLTLFLDEPEGLEPLQLVLQGPRLARSAE
jgi:hypothetical protein